MTKKRLIGAAAALAVAALALLVISQRPDRNAGQDDSKATSSSTDPSRPVPGDALYIAEAVAKPHHVVMGQSTTLKVVAVQGAQRAGALRYTWQGQGTIAAADAAETTWTAPYKVGNHFLRVVVADAKGQVEAKVRISVRLPSPKDDVSLAVVMRKAAAERQEKLLARHAEGDKRLAELREQLKKKKTSVEDHLRAQRQLEEMGRILKDLGRYEDALAVFQELRGGVLNTDRNYKKYSASVGEMQFFLGNDKEALAAFQAAGPYCHGTNRYYMAELLERNGDVKDAIASYAKAAEHSPWFGDPVYRKAMLSLEDGGSIDDVAQDLVDASPRLDKDRMLERLRTDQELTPLMDALHKTSRIGDLQAQQKLVRKMPTPEGPPPASSSTLNSPYGSSTSGGSSSSSGPAPGPTITATPVPGTGATAPQQ